MIATGQLEKRRVLRPDLRGRTSAASNLYHINQPMARLLKAVEELSLARNLDELMAIVRHAARELVGSDGATFVLRDGDHCFYAEEDAIAPLWKGQRFPMTSCISGWTMLHSEPAVIEDIYSDRRIPADVYRPTFVKSLVMVPIRSEAPIGAIGNYWARRHAASEEEVDLLRALANTTAVAIQNVQLYADLERRVKERTAELEAANRELEAYSYAVSHDLSAPLRRIASYAQILNAECGPSLSKEGLLCLNRIEGSTQDMRSLMDDLLRLSKVSLGELARHKVDLSGLARQVAGRLASEMPEREVSFEVAPGLTSRADQGLVRIALENLLSNAWKYTARNPHPKVEFGACEQPDGTTAFFVRDNGVGFDMQSASLLFQPFRRMHARSEFPGTGLGLTTVQRVVQKHGGRIWADAAPGQGATFYFTLGQ